MVSTLKKGNKLEDKFYQYLLDQKNQGDLVFGVHSPELCKIHKKKKYYCKVREADVEFDVVIELYRQGSTSPHLYVIFECKNHTRNVQENQINDFSVKLSRMFQHAAKGVMVVSSPLQSGAEKVAKNSKIGIVKYEEDGFEIIADRTGGLCAENRFVKTQIFKDESPVKALKFSAYHDGNFFGSIDRFLRYLDPSLSSDDEYQNDTDSVSVPYLRNEEIQQFVQIILKQIDYTAGPVDLAKICSELFIDLQYTNQEVQDSNGNPILGSANFDRKSILINSHENKQRERFTIGHEIGHFCLRHDRYLRSETIVERDLLINSAKKKSFNYDWLEFQANAFASELLLPNNIFRIRISEFRADLDIRDIGHGYIFVDDQPCNYEPYSQLLSKLSSYFEVSKQAVEIKLKKMRMLTDQRKRRESLSISHTLANLGFSRRG